MVHSQSTLHQVLDRLFGKNGDQSLTVRNLCYTAFMKAKAENAEDGGSTDWFTDTLPLVEDGILQLRQLLVEELGAFGLVQPAGTKPEYPDFKLDNDVLDAIVAESSARPQRNRFAATRWAIQETFAAVSRRLHTAPVDMTQQPGEVWPVRTSALDSGLFEVAVPDGTWLSVMALTEEHARRLAAYDWSEKDEAASLVAAE